MKVKIANIIIIIEDCDIFKDEVKKLKQFRGLRSTVSQNEIRLQKKTETWKGSYEGAR